MQKLLVISIFLTACSGSGYEFPQDRPDAKDGTFCDVLDQNTGGMTSAHISCSSEPWTNESSGLSCRESPSQVGDSCRTVSGALGIVEDY